MNYFFTFTLLAATVTLLGCNRRDDQTVQPGYPATNGIASFRIDNRTWAAAANVSGSMGLLSAQSGTERLEIRLPSFNPGTYQLTTSPSSYVVLNQFGTPPVNYDSYTCSPAAGNINITSFDQTTNPNTITGTFVARVCGGGQQREIMQGVFTRIPVQ